MYKFLNDYLYNEMFDDSEKEAIIKIDGEAKYIVNSYGNRVNISEAKVAYNI